MNYPDIKLGNHKDSCGTADTMAILISSTKINGITAFDREASEIFAKSEATNKLRPTGGVTMPTDRFTTMIMPKCTGSIRLFRFQSA